MKEELEAWEGEIIWTNMEKLYIKTEQTFQSPTNFYIVIILIFKLTASYNLSYNIHHIISPNTIIAPDKELNKELNKVLDKAFALAPNARYRYRTCSITALSSL